MLKGKEKTPYLYENQDVGGTVPRVVSVGTRSQRSWLSNPTHHQKKTPFPKGRNIQKPIEAIKRPLLVEKDTDIARAERRLHHLEAAAKII